MPYDVLSRWSNPLPKHRFVDGLHQSRAVLWYWSGWEVFHGGHNYHSISASSFADVNDDTLWRYSLPLTSLHFRISWRLAHNWPEVQDFLSTTRKPVWEPIPYAVFHGLFPDLLQIYVHWRNCSNLYTILYQHSTRVAQSIITCNFLTVHLIMISYHLCYLDLIMPIFN
jgi:hypothetical protein